MKLFDKNLANQVEVSKSALAKRIENNKGDTDTSLQNLMSDTHLLERLNAINQSALSNDDKTISQADLLERAGFDLSESVLAKQSAESNFKIGQNGIIDMVHLNERTGQYE
ncbi:MAG: hypothetical protein OXF77_05355 [Thaumarchaeota archaeon]|nr:hypothetical protein [Nitrososphaerota archaeon]